MPLHNRSRIAVFAVAAVCILLPQAAGAHSVGTVFTDVGIDQKLGAILPLDTTFRGEHGETVTLKSLVTAPTILALVYYQCPNVCDLLLTGLAGVVGPLSEVPGKDYNIVTISIDPTETPKEARKSKERTLQSIQKPYPAQAWRFLTGDEEGIDAVSRAVGFHYIRNGDGFDHPVALVILSPAGKVVRYMLGSDFLPADLSLSLLEAQKGAIGPTIAKLVRICFRVDPKSHAFVFEITKVMATITLVLAGSLAAYLIVAGRKRKRRLGGT